MHKFDPVNWRCGILDVLEAAALHGDHAEIRVDGRWQCIRVVDVVSDRGDDWLVTDDGQRIAVGAIEMARPLPG